MRYLFLVVFFLPVFFLWGCEDEVEPPQEERILYYKYYAAGFDVAPLFRAFPLRVDSIFVQIRVETPNMLAPDVFEHRIYMKTFSAGSSDGKVLTGKDLPLWGAIMDISDDHPEGIVSFSTRNATESGENVKIIGIYQKGERSLTLEYVYDHPDWPDPPNASDGFGSTAGGGYGENNIHYLTRIIDTEEDEK